MITKEKKGITLVALVITIILILILAGISISILAGENGLIEKVKKSSTEYKKSQYFEEINIEILEEKMERAANNKTEPFIVSLNKRLIGDLVASTINVNAKPRKEWISSTVMCDVNGVENDDNFLNTVIIVTTVDNYEIFVNVDNEKQTADVHVESFKKAEAPCQITYDLNNGTGTLINAITSIRNGFKLTLPSDTGISRQYYTFAGWCEDKDGNGTIYAKGARTDERITRDTTFYAIWTQNSVVVTFDGNGGEGTMENSTIIIGQATKLPANGYIKTGYTFSKWTSNKGQEYANEEEITITEDITLTAVWTPISYTINVVNGKFEDETTSKTVNYGESITATAAGLPSSGWSEWQETVTGTKVSSNKTYAWSGDTSKTITVTGNETITFNYTDTTIGTKTKYKVSFDGYSDKDLWTSDTGDGSFTFPEAPTQEGKIFQGWGTTSTASSGVAAGSSGTVSEPTKYYATWKNSRLTIYTNGALDSSITGLSLYRIYSGYSKGSFSYNNGYVELVDGNNIYSCLKTNNRVDISQYSTIHIIANVSGTNNGEMLVGITTNSGDLNFNANNGEQENPNVFLIYSNDSLSKNTSKHYTFSLSKARKNFYGTTTYYTIDPSTTYYIGVLGNPNYSYSRTIQITDWWLE